MNIKATDSNIPSFGNAQGAKRNAKNAVGGTTGKFDIFTMTGSGKTEAENGAVTSADKRQAELIRRLEKLPDEEKADAAVKCYFHMQGLLNGAADAHRQAIDIFNNLRDERSSLEELLANDCVITDDDMKYIPKLIAYSGRLSGNPDGKIDLSGFRKGEQVDKEVVLKALDNVNTRLEKFIKGERFGSEKFNKAQNNMAASDFRRAAEMFRALTGTDDESLDLNDDCLTVEGIDGINEDNFIRKHMDAIEGLEKRSENLKDFFGGLMKKNGLLRAAYEERGSRVTVRSSLTEFLEGLNVQDVKNSLFTGNLSV